MRQVRALFAVFLFFVVVTSGKGQTGADAPVKEPLDPITGLIMAEGWELVRTHCIACHSMKIITQAGKDRSNWGKTLLTMQRTGGLYPLGELEGKILDYLEKNYPIADRPHNAKIRMGLPPRPGAN